jgi:alpha-glucosidase
MNHAAISWWREGILYQIYPRSFQDSNGDGIDDLPGIISRMLYLRNLGVDAIWVSPIFPSPMAGVGYDISNYLGADPIFGNAGRFQCARGWGACERPEDHSRSSSESHFRSHPWFIESRSSRDSPKRDWYLWREPRADGTAPNNWMSELAAALGNTTPAQSNIIITPSSHSSPI